MLALIQRISWGKVLIKGKIYSEIEEGYVILLGIFKEDGEEDVKKLTQKIVHLRLMSDQEGKMNKSILETKGEVLVVSQFTLAADLSGGRRPSFINAMEPAEARKLYELFIKELQQNGLTVKTGSFGGYMEVQITNDGPVTISVDSKKL